jgi:tRNA1(Val) A37 N6-methylase TrmN6
VPEALPESLTEDGLLGGRVRLSQPARGYRAAIDPVLLAAAVPATAGETVLDAGAGTGAASLALAVRVPGCRIVGLEIQRDLQRLASRNARQNELGRRVEVIEGDLGRPPPRLVGTIFDHVMTNPPHLAAAAAIASPVQGRARAHVEHQLDLAGWLAACLRMLRPGGVLTLVHRADRLADALAPLRGPLGDLVIYPLWPRAGDRPAKRVLVQGRKGSRGPLRLARGLVLHDDSGGFSAAAEAVLRHAKDLLLLDPRNGSGDG